MSSDLSDRRFWLAKEDEIKRAETTDIYFVNTAQVLAAKGHDPEVVMEIYARGVPYPDPWGIVTGIYEVAKLLEGLPISVSAMEEGEAFLTAPGSAIYEPILQIEGPYKAFAPYENPVLGLLCSSTSVSTKAARVKAVAGDKTVFSFGTRRTHPALAPLIERAAYIGGFENVSNVLGAKLMGKKPVGTMPHALIQCIGEPVEAWRAFDEVMPRDLLRIALVDTFYDEKTEAIMAWEALGSKLDGVRLDTPSSRRGDFKKIVEEVRWELNIRGGNKVKIFVSGGMDENDVANLAPLADGFGVGTSVSWPPVIDFSAKIVEVKAGGKTLYRAKRGDIGGMKSVYRNEKKFEDILLLAKDSAPQGAKPLLAPLISNGKIVRTFRSIDDIRRSVLSKVKRLRSLAPRLVAR
ncbi:MAG: nicotinate phosphoribosyltransferase [Thaumarchaeota archaeon]|nr:nicotinate phosphoribosyltransferase [Nitrososphaerota archaeon]